MSDDERYQIIGRVVSEHEQRKRDLAALEAKASGIAGVIERAARVLRTGENCNIEKRTFFARDDASGRVTEATLPTWEEVAQLLRQLETVRQDIRELETQRRNLGV